MEKLIQLSADIAKLWGKYGDSYITGMRNTLILALVATVIGCVIGFVCGVLNTIPYSKTDPLLKRFLLKLIRVIVRVYVEVFRGTPRCCHSGGFHQHRRIHGRVRPGRHYLHRPWPD